MATFTTIEPHSLQVNDSVSVAGALVQYYSADNNPYLTNPGNPYNSVNGSPFIVSAVPAPNQFQYLLPFEPLRTLISQVPLNAGGSPIFSKGSMLNVVTAQSLVHESLGSTKALFQSVGNHGFNTDDFVSIFGVKMNTADGKGTFLNPYNGVFQITKLSPSEFTYDTGTALPANAMTNPAPACAKQVGTALIREGAAAIFRTVRPHFFDPDQIVLVDHALVAGNENRPYAELGIRVIGPGTE